MAKINLIGTGHIFDLSVAMKSVIKSRKPNILCVELDEGRLNALLYKKRGRMPFPYGLLAKIQENIAARYGVKPGSEMMAGIEEARNCGARIECIDVDARSLIDRIWKKMTFKEKIGLLFGSLAGIFAGKKRIEREIITFEKSPKEYLSKIGEGFPVIKEILIDERNEWMGNKLLDIAKENENIVAIVGEGHIPGMKEILDEEVELELEIIRLRDLREIEKEKGEEREGKEGKEGKENGSQARITISYDLP